MFAKKFSQKVMCFIVFHFFHFFSFFFTVCIVGVFLVICEFGLVVMFSLAWCVIFVLVLHVVCVYFDIANVNNGGSH